MAEQLWRTQGALPAGLVPVGSLILGTRASLSLRGTLPQYPMYCDPLRHWPDRRSADVRATWV